MIRPITIVTFLLACGSGMYLYQSKHEVQLLDRTIERTVHETGAMREQSRLLAAEWTMLNDPDRLRQFADTYLSLKSINPQQFTSLNDLGSKLAPPIPEQPAVDETPVVQTAPQPEPESPIPEAAPSVAVSKAPVAVAADDALPVPPPVPAARPVQVAAPPVRLPEPKVAMNRPAAEVKTEPRAADPRPAEPKASVRVAEAHPDTRTPSALVPRPIVLPSPRLQPAYTQARIQPPAVVASPRPVPVAAPPPALAPAPAPFTGSLLGMARGSTPPAPRPTPVNATYNAN